MTDEPPEANSPGPSRKTIIGWTVGMLAVLSLAVGGGLLYRPLKLRYASYTTVARARAGELHMDRNVTADEWFLICLDGACAGDRTAIDAMIDTTGIRVRRNRTDGKGSPTNQAIYLTALAQPEPFFERVAKRKDEHVERVLWVLCRSLCDGRQEPYWALGTGLPVLASWFEAHVQFAARIGDERRRRLAQAALAFTRQRFAKELAAAKGKGTPK